ARAGDIVTFTWRVTGAESVTIWRLDPAGTPVNPPLGAGMPLQSAARYTFPAYYGTTVDFYLGAVSGGAIVAGARLSVTMPG
ncbi:MAG: hypothetical protein JW910_13060, partial [Anaerolineae bacterium]|nr:hypothetical protein [Anaerolineae bacterium]